LEKNQNLYIIKSREEAEKLRKSTGGGDENF
jgi:hypothetical protein